jgi:hypothetical protein
MGNIIAWDIETVPDLKGFAAANGHDGKSDDEVRAETRRQVSQAYLPLNHLYWSVWLRHRENGGHWIVDAIGAPRIGERPENALISAFVDRIAELSPQLVTFNGSSFDAIVCRRGQRVRQMSRCPSGASLWPSRALRTAVQPWTRVPAARRAIKAKCPMAFLAAALRTGLTFLFPYFEHSSSTV